MKLKSAFSKILTNKWVLNIISLLSLLTVIGYLMMDKFNAIAYFIVLGLIVYYFSKNMIIVLGTPLILVNLLVYMHGVKEGLENNTTTQTTPPPSTDNNSSTDSSTTQNNNNNTSKQPNKTPQGLPRTNIGPVDDQINSSVSLESSTDASHDALAPQQDSFEVGRPKRSGGYNIDYASTIEGAYDELNKIIGGDGIKRLTGDTQKLMNQQLQLAEAMKGMGPLIKGMAPLMQQAQGLLGGMGDKEGGLGGIMELAKKFGGSPAPVNA